MELERLDDALSGEERYTAKREAGLSQVRRDGSLYNPDTDRWSTEAEAWGAACFACPANTDIYQTHGDEGYDLRPRLDVKWLGQLPDGHARRVGHLAVNLDVPDCDYPAVFIAISGYPPLRDGWRIEGLITGPAFIMLREKRALNASYGPKWVVHTRHLVHDIRLLRPDPLASLRVS